MVSFFEKFFLTRITGPRLWHTVLREVITMNNCPDNKKQQNPENKKQQNFDNKKQQSSENKKQQNPENKNPTSRGY